MTAGDVYLRRANLLRGNARLVGIRSKESFDDGHELDAEVLAVEPLFVQHTVCLCVPTI